MTSGDTELEALRALAPDLARHDAAEVARLLAPFLGHLRNGLAPGHAREAVDAVSLAARALYGHARALEALALARELLAYCERDGDRTQTRRAAGVCGVLVTEGADLVAALGYHAQALRIAAAEEDRLEMARDWNNIGRAIMVSGRSELAARAFRRCLALLEPVMQPTHVRYAALANLTDCEFQLGLHDEGIAHSERALRELEGIGPQDAYDVILLRRNVVRLLLARDRADDAAEHVARAISDGAAAPSPRTAIAVDLIQAAYDLATGSPDLALTRLDRTLARAREVPATLHDALAHAVRAEEAAGNPARALLRLQELSEHVYGHAVVRTREAIEIAGMDAAEPAADYQRHQVSERLTSLLEPSAPPQAWEALRRLSVGAVLRMDDTGWHGVRVGALVKALALEWGCPPLQALELGLAAELHDIGMSSIPAAVLGKQGPLNGAERAIVRRHAEAGAAILVDDPHSRLLLARDIARYHHARWDGEGYPERVGGAAIPLGARMCAIADAYDVMVCGLAGREPVPMGEALAELGRAAGRQFDPELVSCFDTIVNDELAGLGLDPRSVHGMESFHELIASLKEDRGFI